MEKIKLVKIGENLVRWTWEYDTVLVYANLFLDINNNNLVLVFDKKHFKSGIGQGVYEEVLGRYFVGTIKKPNLKEIRTQLKFHKQHNAFRARGWKFEKKGDMLISELIEYIRTDSPISRKLKLIDLQKKIKAKQNG